MDYHTLCCAFYALRKRLCGLANYVLGCKDSITCHRRRIHFCGHLTNAGGLLGLCKANRIAEIAYAKLHRFIAVELTLPRAERVAPKDMLKFCRDTIERLAETSPLVPDAIVKEFHAKFGHEYEGVAIPDRANGLRRIQINKTVMSPEANAAVIVLAAGAPGTPPSSE